MIGEFPSDSDGSDSEAVVAAVEVVEELIESEAVDPYSLELKIERGIE